MTKPIDLTFTSTNELIDELAKRHDGIVITGIKFTTPVNFILTKHWGGNHFVCLGILEDMKNVIHRQGEKNFNPDK